MKLSLLLLSICATFAFGSQYDIKLFPFEYNADSLVLSDSLGNFRAKFVWKRTQTEFVEYRITANRTDTTSYHFDQFGDLTYSKTESDFTIYRYDSGKLTTTCTSTDSSTAAQCTASRTEFTYLNDRILELITLSDLDTFTSYYAYNARGDVSTIRTVSTAGTEVDSTTYSYDYLSEIDTVRSFRDSVLTLTTINEFKDGRQVKILHLKNGRVVQSGVFYYSVSRTQSSTRSVGPLSYSKPKGRYYLINGRTVDMSGIRQKRNANKAFKP